MNITHHYFVSKMIRSHIRPYFSNSEFLLFLLPDFLLFGYCLLFILSGLSQSLNKNFAYPIIIEITIILNWHLLRLVWLLRKLSFGLFEWLCKYGRFTYRSCLHVMLTLSINCWQICIKQRTLKVSLCLYFLTVGSVKVIRGRNRLIFIIISLLFFLNIMFI